MDEILATAQAVVEQRGQRGAIARRRALELALDAAYPDLAVVIAAARWTDRYGRAGAGDALRVLTDAIAARTSGGPS